MTIQEFFDQAEQTVKDGYYCSFEHEKTFHRSGNVITQFFIYCSNDNGVVVFNKRHINPEVVLSEWKDVRARL